MSEHVPAGHTEIWYPKSQPKQIDTHDDGRHQVNHVRDIPLCGFALGSRVDKLMPDLCFS